VVKEWKRGTPLSAAKTIFEGETDDVWVHGQHYYDHGVVYDALHRGLTFYTAKEYIRIGAWWRRGHHRLS
jgi:prolyl oligopeptidase